MNGRNSIRKVVTIFLLGLVLGASTIAFAATVHSPWGYYGPYLGYNYKNQAGCDVFTGSAFADTAVEQNPNGSGVPAGYMGAQAYLYFNDVVVKNTTMRYTNSDGYIRLYVNTSTYYGNGTYYSKGKSAAYNGNGYNYFYTFQSPSQTN